MAATLVRGLRWAYSQVGGQPTRIRIPLSTGETIKRGYPLVLCATTGSAHIYAAADTGIFAVADEDVTSTATEATAYVHAIPMALPYVWEGVGAASVMTTSASLTRLSRGSVHITTAGYYRLNTVAASARFAIVDYPNATRDATGAGRKWYVSILASASQYANAAAGVGAR